jgi:protein ImuB
MSSAAATIRPSFACLYAPPAPSSAERDAAAVLTDIAREFSPRYERHGTHAVAIDVTGLDRLLGPPRVIGEELRRDAATRGARLHVAVAANWMTALVLAYARAGLTVVRPGEEAAVLAPVPLGVLEKVLPGEGHGTRLPSLKTWGIRTLGELAALPSEQLAARLGRGGLALQAVASGEDRRPLVPDIPEERFESSSELEWPIDGVEPLSFVLTRLLEPLCIRLERRDRGAAVLHVMLRLVTRDEHARRLELPSPLRDMRTLRTLALLDMESHPPGAAIDRVTVVIEPTPGRVVQHTLFTRPHPTPEQLSTLLARLGAVLGQDRIGAPAVVDSFRPDAFALQPFAVDWNKAGTKPPTSDLRPPISDLQPLPAALRRCRGPVAARVTLAAGRPLRVVTDRRGFAGGAVASAWGPWRTSVDWWAARGCRRDEWDVVLSDGAVYRIFRDHDTDRWFVDGIFD